jgi:hypothetical protein
LSFGSTSYEEYFHHHFCQQEIRMSGPRLVAPEIEVVGIYAPCADRERCEVFIRDWLAELSDFPRKRLAELENQLKTLLQEVVLVEVFVSNPDERFTIDNFLQPDPSAPKETWQAAWQEVFLSERGDEPADLSAARMPSSSCFRVAFYIHFWRPDLGLATSYGHLSCPSAQVMPERLWKLAPYDLP